MIENGRRAEALVSSENPPVPRRQTNAAETKRVEDGAEAPLEIALMKAREKK